MIQENVERLCKLGPFPAYEERSVLGSEEFTRRIQEIGDLVDAIEEPVSDDDARVLVTLFGPDDCFGIADHLMTVIETAPGWPLIDALDSENNYYINLLRQRSINGGRLPGVKFPLDVAGGD